MSVRYFGWLTGETQSRAWINNPTRAELEWSLSEGAVGCTTNPAYGGNLLQRASREIEPDIEAAVEAGLSGDEAVAWIQERLVSRILPWFAPLHARSGSREGWVSLQGAPELDTEPEPILASARAARALGENCIPKIPATAPGLKAMDVLLRDGHPVLMTEVFSLAQVVETSERYVRATADLTERPAFIMAPITGIFGDHLRKLAERDGLAVAPESLAWAGIIWARAAKRLVDERGYPVQLLYGGARTMGDLTELVGGPHASTINWSTFAEVLEADPERRETVDDPSPDGIEERLRATCDDFDRALRIDGLDVGDFEAFGPVQHFRDNFIAGWNAVREAVEEAGSLART